MKNVPIYNRLAAILILLTFLSKQVVASPYEEAFQNFYNTLGKQSANIKLKNIDWPKVGRELLPLAENINSEEEFGLLCMQLLAQLQDSHATLQHGTAKVPSLDFPQWSPGFNCFKDDRGKPVVYFIAPGSPAEKARMKPGMEIVSIDGQSAESLIEHTKKNINKYIGYSSDRYLEYHALRWFARQTEQDKKLTVVAKDKNGRTKKFRVTANRTDSYLPRLPLPIEGISDGGANIQWKVLRNRIGYIYVRRIQEDLNSQLEKAVQDLSKTKGIILDVRGNSGGGFDSTTAHHNFNIVSSPPGGTTVYTKPVALLLSPRCISAGEGWASWFIANKRATTFGEATAGASGRKTTIDISNGLYKARFVVKAYKGYLDRPIEGRGLEPDIPVIQTASDLSRQKDTVLETAIEHLLKQSKN